MTSRHILATQRPYTCLPHQADEHVVIDYWADYRAGRQNRQNWLQGRLAGLTSNLPEQLHDLTLTGPCDGGTDCGPVTRRDLMELLPAATVRSVLAVKPLSRVHVSVYAYMHVPVCVAVCIVVHVHVHVCAHV